MKQRKLFLLSGGAYFLSSLSVLLMCFGDMSGQNGSKPIAIISAILFWLFFLMGIFMQQQLRQIQKPFRQRLPLSALILTPPTLWLEIAFLLFLIVFIVLNLTHIDGFIAYFVLSLALLNAEWSLLSMGKFRMKNGKIILKLYRKPANR